MARVASGDRAEARNETASERDYTVRAVDRVCAILDLLQGSLEGVSLNEVADATGLPKSSAFRYLWTLQAHRYVERDEEQGAFRLGLGFIGMQSRGLELLRQRARPALERLRDEFDETINLGVLDGDTATYLDIVESRRSVRLAAKRGDHDELHSTAIGKAITAFLPEGQVREMLERAGMPAKTQRTITEVKPFLAELDKVRSRGYAVDEMENETDGRCVAVPLLGTFAPAAISLSAPSARFPSNDVERVAGRLREAAAAIVQHRSS
jgi:IclR family acetate operon transcriptional repressor